MEEVALIDKYAKSGKTSLAYRITYRSNDRTLTNEEINKVQMEIRKFIEIELKVTLR